MNSRDFCYWLHGWFELNETFDHPNKIQLGPQLEMIKNHLDLVFENITSEKSGIKTSNPIGFFNQEYGNCMMSCSISPNKRIY